MSEVIRAVDLTKHYRKIAALDGLNLVIPEGSVFGLVGPNGAGKTTTIKTVMNILKPDSGHAEVLGVDSRRIGPAELARIGYVSENQEMPDWMTLAYLLAYLKPFYPSWDDAYAAHLVSQFDLPRDRKLRHLSRGMRMKAALVSSLAYRPQLLVLDEPFSGLDPMVREDLIEGILESAEETTILVSSHDLAEIESFASHIGYLEAGRLRFAEEMTSLSARFREIEVTLDASMEAPEPIRGPDEWPVTWLRLDSIAGIVRFVETDFDADRATGDIRRLFGEVRNISVNPMPLRAIFVALARSRPKAV
jgi:ABC-2 type transport system ATP-binding protein